MRVQRAEKPSAGKPVIGAPAAQLKSIAVSLRTTAGAPARSRLVKYSPFHAVMMDRGTDVGDNAGVGVGGTGEKVAVAGGTGVKVAVGGRGGGVSVGVAGRLVAVGMMGAGVSVGTIGTGVSVGDWIKKGATAFVSVAGIQATTFTTPIANQRVSVGKGNVISKRPALSTIAAPKVVSL